MCPRLSVFQYDIALHKQGLELKTLGMKRVAPKTVLTQTLQQMTAWGQGSGLLIIQTKFWIATTKLQWKRLERPSGDVESPW